MKTRAKWILPGLLIGFLTLLGASGCQPATKEQTMNTKTEPTRAAPAVPALDQAQPESFATATFSMG
ncbi:MAG: hypothetical protein IH586_18260 [Anaerolineaceae bacterium]|nr:hypothetical protein [Anaerolineaceae bacterium]